MSDGVQCYEGDGDDRPGLTDAILSRAADELHLALGLFLRGTEGWPKIAKANQATSKLHRAYDHLTKCCDDVNLARRRGTMQREQLAGMRSVETMSRWFNGVFKHSMTLSEAFGTDVVNADLVQLMGCMLKWQGFLVPKAGD